MWDEIWEEAHKAWYDSPAMYTSRWRGIRTYKHPADLWVIQEIIYETGVEVIVETGSAHGGSANYYGDLGVEVHSVDLAPPKTPAPHPNVTYYTGYSVAPMNLYRIGKAVEGKRTMVLLDSDHHKANVLAELEAYSWMVTEGCYLIVEDTNFGRLVFMEFEGDGPADALDEWLPSHPEFEVDRTREKHGLTLYPGGWLKRI